MAADFSFSFITLGLGACASTTSRARSTCSPYDGDFVAGVPGVVTALRTNGFWIQDPRPTATSAPRRASSSSPARRRRPPVGDAVTVSGRVEEFRPGGATGTT